MLQKVNSTQCILDVDTLKFAIKNTVFMKTLLYIFIAFLAFAACNEGGSTGNGNTADTTDTFVDIDTNFYGEKFVVENAVTVDEMLNNMGNDTAYAAKVEGTVNEVCKKKGCWMTMNKEDGSTIRVTFKDYGFFVPMDIDGQEVILLGTAKMDSTSVEDLRHYAEDAGKTKEEIEAINEPEIQVNFEAEGVYVKRQG